MDRLCQINKQFIGLFIYLSVCSFACSNEKIQKHVLFYPQGQVRMEFFYYIKDDQVIKHGELKEYAVSGELMKKMIYSHNQLDGKVVSYYFNGKKKWIGHYKNDVRIGKWTYWNSQNVKKIIAKFDETGKPQWIKRFHPNSKIKTKIVFEKDHKQITKYNIAGRKQKSVRLRNEGHQNNLAEFE